MAEVLTFGQRLGLDQYKAPDDKFVVLYNLADSQNRGLLTFNRETGEFSFQSWGTHQAVKTPRGWPEDSPEVEELAKSFLSSLGVIDQTVSCPITYQRKEMEGVTFVECHRDWSLAGLPILNFVGVLNIPEERSLASVALGSVDENFPDDPSIINTSTGDDGKVRPNDFNTTTVAVADDGRILSIDSNLRQIASATTAGQNQLLTPQEALGQFLNHRSQLSLTIPAGAGFVDLAKVYPENLAQAKKATITDYLFTYLEKPAGVSQSTLVPHYLIRGLAQLSSGYNVRFTETVPALKTGLSFLAPLGGTVAGEKTIKLETFTPGPTSPTPLPTNYSLTPPRSSEPPAKVECDLSMLEVIAEIPGIGKIGLFKQPLLGSRTFGYIYPDDPSLKKPIEEVRRAFFVENPGLVSRQSAILVARYIRSHHDVLWRFGGSNPTVNDIYNLYDFINGLSELGAYPNLANLKAPLSPKALNSLGTMVDDYFAYWMSQVAEAAARQLIPAIQNGDIGNLAAENDLFPYTTIMPVAFQAIFYNFSSSNTITPSSRCEYLTGGSPSIYLYPQKPTQVTITLGSPLTYTDPAVRNNSWQVTAHPDGALKPDTRHQIPDTNRHRLYYEYDKSKVSFTEPQEGFVVKRESLEAFLEDNLFPELGLNKQEVEDLLADVKTSLIGSQDSPFINISFVDPKELNQKLPLEISPKPDKIYRIHLMFTPLDTPELLKAPKLLKITRSGFTAIELGALTDND